MSAVRGGYFASSDAGQSGVIRRNIPVLATTSKRVGARLALVEDRPLTIPELGREAAIMIVDELGYRQTETEE